MSMISAKLEAICYILNTKDVDFLLKYDVEFYSTYVFDKAGKKVLDTANCYATEYNIILNYYNKYGVIIDKTSFLGELNTETTRITTLYETSLPAEHYGKKLEDEYYANVIPVINSRQVQTCDSYKKSMTMIGDAITAANEKINNVHAASKLTLDQQMSKYKDEWFARRDATTPLRYSTGLTDLDLITGRISVKEELITLLARTNVGKTWWALFIAHAIWSQGNNVGFYSPEMSEDTIKDRLMCIESHIDLNHLTYPDGRTDLDYSKELDAAIQSIAKKSSKAIFDLKCDANMTVSQLRQWIRTKKLKALFIDGVSYLTADDDESINNKTASWQVAGNITRKLMALSVEMEIPIIEVCQANREATKKQAEEDEFTMPTLATLANSDQIAQHSTKVIAIGCNGNTHRVQVIKNRTGIVGEYKDFTVDFRHGIIRSPIDEDTF